MPVLPVLIVVLLLALARLVGVGAVTEIPSDYILYFRALGPRLSTVKTEKRKLSQEDMISDGFRVRPLQMIDTC
jgi:hypothetical protein